MASLLQLRAIESFVVIPSWNQSELTLVRRELNHFYTFTGKTVDVPRVYRRWSNFVNVFSNNWGQLDKITRET